MKTNPRLLKPAPGVRYSTSRRVTAPLPPRVRLTSCSLGPDGYLPRISYVRVIALLGIIVLIALLASSN